MRWRYGRLTPMKTTLTDAPSEIPLRLEKMSEEKANNKRELQ